MSTVSSRAQCSAERGVAARSRAAPARTPRGPGPASRSARKASIGAGRRSSSTSAIGQRELGPPGRPQVRWAWAAAESRDDLSAAPPGGGSVAPGWSKPAASSGRATKRASGDHVRARSAPQATSDSSDSRRRGMSATATRTPSPLEQVARDAGEALAAAVAPRPRTRGTSSGAVSAASARSTPSQKPPSSPTTRSRPGRVGASAHDHARLHRAVPAVALEAQGQVVGLVGLDRARRGPKATPARAGAQP